MQPLTKAVFTVSLAFALACGRFTDPPKYWYESAKEYAANGEYDDALSTFDRVEKEYPDSPESKLVPNERLRTLIAKGKAAYEKQDYVEGGAALLSAVKADPSKGETFFQYLAEGDPALVSLTYFAAITTDVGRFRTSDSIGKVLADSSASPGLQQAMQQWTCEHHTDLPELASCQAYTPDTSGTWTARNAYADLTSSCAWLQTVTKACDASVTTAVNAAVQHVADAKPLVDPRPDHMPCQIHQLYKSKLDLDTLWDFQYGTSGLPSASRSTNGWTIEQERKSGRTDDEIYASIEEPYEATYEYDDQDRLVHYRQLDPDNSKKIAAEYWFSYGSDGKLLKVRDRGGAQRLVFNDEGRLFANQEHIDLGSIQTTGITLRVYNESEYPLLGLPMVFSKNVVYGEYKAAFTMGDISDASFLWEIEYEGKRIKLIRSETSLYQFQYDCYADK